MRVDMAAGSSVAIALTAVTASATLPANTELVALSTSGNAHFRFTNGASSAVVTDPMITANSQIQLFKLDSATTWTLSVISDAVLVTNGTVSAFRVFEA